MAYPLHAPLHYRLRDLAKRVALDAIEPDQLRERAADLVAHGLDAPSLVVMANSPVQWDHQETVARMNDVLEEVGYPPLDPLDEESWLLPPRMIAMWAAIAGAAPAIAENWDRGDTDFLVAGDLARNLVSRVVLAHDDDEVRRVFDVIEQQLEAWVHVREVILTGVLEDLAGDIERTPGVRNADFEAMFGPETLRLWRFTTGQQ
jgi:hypothetical protein